MLTLLRPQPLAQALTAMLKRAEPPICVGLYARWGSGKTFMISLLKKEFDPDMHEDQHTKQLLQFFEEGYRKPEPEEAAETENVCSLIRGLLFTILLAFVPAMPYGVATFLSVICDAFDPRDTLVWAWCCSSLKRACCARWKPCAKRVRYRSLPQPMPKDTTKPIAKEYVFVDFNAWECAYLASK